MTAFIIGPAPPPARTPVDAERLALEQAQTAGEALPETPKRDLLSLALTQLLEPLAEARAAIVSGQAWDTFALATSVRNNLPVGLSITDFAELDVDYLVPEILTL